jgi:3-deoxy-D-manno-octulosonic-acid transferase
MAKKIAAGNAQVIYFPVDISFITNRAVRLINPAMVILMETELWPNLILSAKHHGARVAIVNARVSPKSFRSYYKVQNLLRGVFRAVDLFLAQTERYAKRLGRLGISHDVIHVTGNMKFDSVDVSDITPTTISGMREKYGLSSDFSYLIGASTHPGEERFLLDVFAELRKANKDLKLIIVPRHIERVNEIVKEIGIHGLTCRIADTSQLSNHDPAASTKTMSDVFVLNTIGELRIMYALADIVFMGGSIIKHGGQNPLEAIALRKPVISGPHVFNFPGIYDALVAMHAATIVNTVPQCLAVANRMIIEKKQIHEIVSRAYVWLEERKGASVRSIRYIEELLIAM